MKNRLRHPLSMLAGAALFMALLELFFSFVPVYKLPHRADFSADRPVQAWKPHEFLLYSRGPFCERPTPHLTNDMGFINGGRSDSLFTIWIYGDSFIESQMHAYPNTLQGRLEKMLARESVAVASINGAGNGLPDYLNGIRLADRHAKRAVHVVVLSNNDIQESFLPYSEGSSLLGLNLFRVHPDGALQTEYGRWEKAGARSMAKKSAALRYLFLNLQFQPGRLLKDGIRREKAASPAAAKAAGTSDIALYARGIRSFLDSLRVATPFPVLFALDCDRDKLVDSLLEDGKRNLDPLGLRIRADFLSAAAEKNFPVVDLCPEFAGWIARHHRAVDMRPADRHWNEEAHALAAQAVYRKIESLGLAARP